MSYAVELFFERGTDKAVRRIWRMLAKRVIAPYLHNSANRPHLTVALYSDIDLAESEAALARFADETMAFPLTLAALGAFPPAREAVVFCAPIVTAHLLDVQTRIHMSLNAAASEPDQLYVPGNWSPHCSLATHCPPERVIDAFAVCLALPLPLDARVEEVGIV